MVNILIKIPDIFNLLSDNRLNKKKGKVGDRSRGRPEGYLFSS